MKQRSQRKEAEEDGVLTDSDRLLRANKASSAPPMAHATGKPVAPSYAPRHAVPPPPPPRVTEPEPATSVSVPQETPKPTLDDAMRLAVRQSAPTVGPPRATVVSDILPPDDGAEQTGTESAPVCAPRFRLLAVSHLSRKAAARA